MSTVEPHPHHVVIVGGGFAGLRAAQGLKRRPMRVTLIDKRNHHVFQPLLYQVATGTLSPANVAAPLRTVLRRQRNAEVFMGEVLSFDAANRRLRWSGGELAYDTLIVAAGSQYNYFGQPWEPVAPSLKSVDDAIRMRRRILAALERAERESDAERRRDLLTFVIIGGGPTGVELAGALAEIARYSVRREFRRIAPSEIRVILLEGMDRILSAMPPSLSAKADASLKRLGVDVRTGCLAKQIDETRVEYQCGDTTATIQTQTVFWTAGVRATGLADRLAQATNAKTDRTGRIIVNADLTLPGHPEIFVIGDMAHCADANGAQLPGLAPVAMQQGTYVARTIARRLDGRAALPPFRYRDRGTMATIGRSAAVADIRGLRFNGVLAWLAWLLVHLMQIVTFQNRVLVFIQWAWHYITFSRSSQLITMDTTLEE